jgi:LuxR family transcriptional regulator, maltose regulon positive regulatory protein
MTPDIGFVAGEAPTYTAAAMIMHLFGKNEAADAYFSAARERLSKAKSELAEFMYFLYRSKFEFDRANEVEARECLRRAMSIGKAYGLSNFYWWHAPIMSELCAKALDADIEPDYVQTLVRKRNLIPDEPPLQVENWPWRVKIRTFDGFEIELDGKLKCRRQSTC